MEQRTQIMCAEMMILGRHTAVVCIWVHVAIRSYQGDKRSVGPCRANIFGSLGKLNDYNLQKRSRARSRGTQCIDLSTFYVRSKHDSSDVPLARKARPTTHFRLQNSALDSLHIALASPYTRTSIQQRQAILGRCNRN